MRIHVRVHIKSSLLGQGHGLSERRDDFWVQLGIDNLLTFARLGYDIALGVHHDGVAIRMVRALHIPCRRT